MDRQTLKMHERDMQKISVKQKIGKVIVLVLIYAFLNLTKGTCRKYP